MLRKTWHFTWRQSEVLSWSSLGMAFIPWPSSQPPPLGRIQASPNDFSWAFCMANVSFTAWNKSSRGGKSRAWVLCSIFWTNWKHYPSSRYDQSLVCVHLIAWPTLFCCSQDAGAHVLPASMEIESNKPIQKIKHASNLTRQRENSTVSYKGRNMLLFHPIIGANKAPGEDGPCQIPRGEVFLLKELREANCCLRCESWRQRWHFWWTKYLNNKHNIRMTIIHNIITSIKIRCLSFVFLFIMSISL